MKHVTRIFLIMVLVSGIVACATAQKQPELPGNLEVLTLVVNMSNKESDVKLKGTGFTPGQEVMILIADVDGVQTDIGWALDPEPKADAGGAWEPSPPVCRFLFGRAAAKKAPHLHAGLKAERRTYSS